MGHTWRHHRPREGHLLLGPSHYLGHHVLCPPRAEHLAHIPSRPPAGQRVEAECWGPCHPALLAGLWPQQGPAQAGCRLVQRGMAGGRPCPRLSSRVSVLCLWNEHRRVPTGHKRNPAPRAACLSWEAVSRPFSHHPENETQPGHKRKALKGLRSEPG